MEVVIVGEQEVGKLPAPVPAPSPDPETSVRTLLDKEPVLCEMERNFDDCTGCVGGREAGACGVAAGTEVLVSIEETKWSRWYTIYTPRSQGVAFPSLSTENWWRHCWLTAPDDASYKRIVEAICGEGSEGGGVVATAAGGGGEACVATPKDDEEERVFQLRRGNWAVWALGLLPIILFSVCISGPAYYLETSNCKVTSGPLPKPSAWILNGGNTSAVPEYWNTKWSAFTGPQTAIPDDPNTGKPSLTMPIGNDAGLCSYSLEDASCRIVRNRGSRTNKCLHVHEAGCILWRDAGAWKEFDSTNLQDYGVKSSLADSALGMVRGYQVSLAGTVVGWTAFPLIFFFGLGCCKQSSPSTVRKVAAFHLIYYSLLLALSAVALHGFNLQASSQKKEHWQSVFPKCDVAITAGPTFGILVFNLIYLSILVLAVFIINISSGAFSFSKEEELGVAGSGKSRDSGSSTPLKLDAGIDIEMNGAKQRGRASSL